MQIERRRVRGRPRLPRAVAFGVVGALALGSTGVAAAAGVLSGFGTSQVGDDTAQGIVLPSNQHIRPVGERALVDNGQLISSTVSPDGAFVAALTTGRGIALTILDADSGKIIQQAGTDSTADLRLKNKDVAPDGPLYSKDGSTLWFGQEKHVLRLSVAADGTVSAPTSIPIPDGPGGAKALPSGMALSEDGSKLYVALNGKNTLGVIDTATATLVSETPVEHAPRQVELVGDTAFVSNEGGRPAAPGEFTNDSYGTPIVADPVTGAATTGSVSVVDLVHGAQTSSIPVGLQPTALYRHGSTLFVANSNDDSVSIIDTGRRKVTQTFNANPLPGSTADGHHVNGITMPDNEHLLVSLGRDNALAVYGFEGAQAPVSYQGLLPTDFYPSGVQTNTARGEVVVTNMRGIGARGPVSTIDKGPGTRPATGHNTHNVTGSLTTFTMPAPHQLARYTHEVFLNNGWDRLLASEPKGNPNATPVPVPKRLGEPSPIKHVFMIIKENRSYDQVLGDVGKGNGDPSLTQFGRVVTPNLHALSTDFTLFDNFYDIGTNSADGHNWLMQADATDYLESEFGQFTRSYPGAGGDALAYQRDGFLWNAAARAGKSVRNFGEYVKYMNVPSKSDGGPSWVDWYQDSLILEGKATGELPVPIDKYTSYSDIPSLNAITDHAYPKYNLGIPDQYRTDIWLRSFRESEKTGDLADLNLIRLPVDHTSGLKSTNPYPIAQVADNDLALGRMVDAITHSKFWQSSAIFVLEDDTQNGVDHVDGHRGPLSIISPYAKRGGVDSSYYTQLNMLATIEQILGIAPMNQKDRAAEPMTGAFQRKPDLAPYTVRPNNIPLTYGLRGNGKNNPPPAPPAAAAVPAPAAPAPALAAPVAPVAPVAPAPAAPAAEAPAAQAPPAVPPAMQAVHDQWAAWSEQQRFNGPEAAADVANPEQMNRLTWYIGHGWVEPFPGDSAILGPDQVPGRFLPANDTDG